MGKKKKTPYIYRGKSILQKVHEMQRQDDGLWACTQVETDSIEKQNKASGSSINFAALNQKRKIKI